MRFKHMIYNILSYLARARSVGGLGLHKAPSEALQKSVAGCLQAAVADKSASNDEAAALRASHTEMVRRPDRPCGTAGPRRLTGMNVIKIACARVAAWATITVAARAMRIVSNSAPESPPFRHERRSSIDLVLSYRLYRNAFHIQKMGASS